MKLPRRFTCLLLMQHNNTTMVMLTVNNNLIIGVAEVVPPCLMGRKTSQGTLVIVLHEFVITASIPGTTQSFVENLPVNDPTSQPTLSDYKDRMRFCWEMVSPLIFHILGQFLYPQAIGPFSCLMCYVYQIYKRT